MFNVEQLDKKKGINVVSVFDGMGCAMQALERLGGVIIENYFASEIDEHAIKTTSIKYPNIHHLGDIRNIKGADLPKIDLFVGGSPCQGFSFAGKGLNFKDPRSALFFEYVRLMNELRERNPDIIFLLENVRMKKKYEDVISRILDIQPLNINSNLLSAQNRDRLYWTNIGVVKHGLFSDDFCSIPQPKNNFVSLQSILEPIGGIDQKYFLSSKKLSLLDNSKGVKAAPGLSGCLKFGRTDEAKEIRKKSMRKGRDYSPFQAKQIIGIDYDKMNTITTATTKDNLIIDDDSRIRKLTVKELCRMQTVDDEYFFSDGVQIVSDNQICKLIGNGWTVDVICYIFSFLPKWMFNGK